MHEALYVVRYFSYLCFMFKRKILRFVREKDLFAGGDTVVVALSGGADSVALLRVLVESGVRCVAAHCNFHLRGTESDRDEAFVRTLCARLEVPLHVADFDTKAYAAAHHVSVEMAARELRYAWFEQIRMQEQAQAIAVAHHRDDSVETFLLNLVRGTGIQGLKGIAAKNGKVVRPFLEVSREEILCYLKQLGQDYVTDSTNAKDVFMRNKIRLDVLPLLKEINPSVSETIAGTARRLADVEAVYRSAMEESCKRVKDDEGRIHISSVLREVSPQAVLFELLHPLGFNSAQLNDIYRSLDGESGRLFYSADYVVLRDRDCLLVRKREETEEVVWTLQQETVEVNAGFQVPKDVHVACLDASKVKAPLVLRKWQAGDKFVPFGMRGFKKVRDYLRDRKYSLFDKENQYVVCAGDDIVWLVNERTDNRFRVTGQTRRVLMLRVKKDTPAIL